MLICSHPTSRERDTSVVATNSYDTGRAAVCVCVCFLGDRREQAPDDDDTNSQSHSQSLYIQKKQCIGLYPQVSGICMRLRACVRSVWLHFASWVDHHDNLVLLLLQRCMHSCAMLFLCMSLRKRKGPCSCVCLCLKKRKGRRLPGIEPTTRLEKNVQ